MKELFACFLIAPPPPPPPSTVRRTLSAALSPYGRLVSVKRLTVRGFPLIRTGIRMVSMSVFKPIPPEAIPPLPRLFPLCGTKDSPNFVFFVVSSAILGTRVPLDAKLKKQPVHLQLPAQILLLHDNLSHLRLVIGHRLHHPAVWLRQLHPLVRLPKATLLWPLFVLYSRPSLFLPMR